MATKNKRNEVVVKEQATAPVVAGSAADLNEWGPAPQLEASLTVIGRILMMQSGSEPVKKRDFSEGDLVLSTEKKVLARLNEELEVIPFRMDEKWAAYSVVMDSRSKSVKKTWLKTFPLIRGGNTNNANLPYSEEQADGSSTEHVHIMDFFVLRPDALESLPVILSFRKTSLRAGKMLYTMMYGDNYSAGLPPAGYTVLIKPVLQTNDKGTFVVLEVRRGRKSTPDELIAALKWHRLMSKGQGPKVDNSDIEQPSEQASSLDEPSDY